ncbi:MAG: hypothetical protein KF784_13085 [Fimbriimonadaceae bacterium]|nr:hypothetical protein [Fimbriimonadaceae bacterium]
MKRRRLNWSAALIVFACLAAVGAVIHVVKPAWYANALESLRRRSEGWEVLKQGDFEAVSLLPVSEEFVQPREFPHGSGLTVRADTSSWFYFRCGKPVGTWESNMGLETKPLSELPSYARLQTPSGASTIVEIQGGFYDPYLYCVQVPGKHPSNLDFIDLTLKAKGCEDTVIRLFKPGKTVPVHEGHPKDTLVQDGVTIKGTANAIKGIESGDTVGIEWSVGWQGLSDQLVWRYTAFSGGNVFQPRYLADKKSSGSFSFQTKNGGGSGNSQAIAYATDLLAMPTSGKLEGYETSEELVDFGTFAVIEETVRSEDRGEKHYFLDFKTPIVRTTPSGMRIVLEPLRSVIDSIGNGGPSVLHYALRVDSSSLLGTGKAQSLGNGQVRIEARIQEEKSLFFPIEPPSNLAGGINASQVVCPWVPKGKSVEMKVRVRRLDRRKYIPFELNIPIDQKDRVNGPWRYSSLDLGMGWQGKKPAALFKQK